MTDPIKRDDALLPCPFCGEEQPPHDDTSWVRCLGCGAETGWQSTGAEAITAWNKRALSALTPTPIDDSQPADPVVNDPAAIREAALSEAALRIGGMIRGHDKTEYEEGYNDALATAERHILALIGEKK